MTPTEKRTCILVLGMHRSGTSALTRTVGLLGAELPKHPLPAGRDNEWGYWEPVRLIKLNDDLLASLNSAWDDWRPIKPNEWAQSFNEWTPKFSQILSDEFDHAKTFVIKDPRMCRFAPLVFESLDNLDIVARTLIPLRNPLEVAASLARRNGFTQEKSLLLWLRYVLDAELATRQRPRAFVSYTRLLSSWQTVAKDISAQLEFKWPRNLSEADPDITDFLSSDLRHHVENITSNSDHIHFSWVFETFYACIALEQSPYDPDTLEKIDFIRKEFETSWALFSPEFTKFQEQLEDTQRDLSESAEKIATLETELSAQRRAAQEAEANAETLKQQLVATQAALNQLQQKAQSSRWLFRQTWNKIYHAPRDVSRRLRRSNKLR